TPHSALRIPRYEVPLRRMRPADAVRGAAAPPRAYRRRGAAAPRPADAVRGAAAPRRRYARGGVPVSPVRPRRRTVDESDGDAAGRVAGREDRRDDDRAAAARNGARDGDDGPG